MPENLSKDNTLYLGICMAGAVSAGAYTAGVMDYLIEALDEWDKRKKANAPNTPSHNVVIPVMGGASAGGMTAIITAAALNNPITPIKEPLSDIMAERPENKLYHSWVDLIKTDMFPEMLNTADMKEEGIISLLNSSFIDKVADRAIAINKDAWRPIPSYFSPDLKIFTTLTNLAGFSYNTGFNAGITSDKYYMTIHNDFACFKMNGKEEDSTEEDGWMHLDFKKETNIDVAKNAAMATGAFPVGLKSRKLLRKWKHVNKIRWDSDIKNQNPIVLDDCDTLNVDGGMINNEPFEKVRDVLNDITGETAKENQDEKVFHSTILMVDPFPSSKPGEFKANQKLFPVIGLTFGAMMNQMSAKPGQIAAALSSRYSGQFLIAPSRKRPRLDNGQEEDVAGDRAIACGALGGFSGFMSKEFRIHDYFLGRFNCEKFLRTYFTISEAALNANPIFSEGYKNVDKNLYKTEKGTYQIIPIFSPAPPKDHLPLPVFSSGTKWPVMQDKTVEAFRPMIKDRVQTLILNLVKLSGITKALMWIGAKVVLNRTITNAAMGTIKKSLNKHQLLKM